MEEYWEYKGTLLNRYEWAGGLSVANSKKTRKEQPARHREVKSGNAVIVNESQWI